MLPVPVVQHNPVVRDPPPGVEALLSSFLAGKSPNTLHAYRRDLADFAAFALNRSQLIGGKAKRSWLDNRVLEILSPIVWNYQNIEKRVVALSAEGSIIEPTAGANQGAT